MTAINKNTVVSAALLLCIALIVLRLIPPSVDPVLKLVLYKNTSNITRLDQARTISEIKTIYIDRLELNQNNAFSHPKLGLLAWGENFFADITTEFTVKNAGNYRFVVGSDDGFALSLDNNKLCSFDRDRPFNRQTCYATLSEGKHTLQLTYFQGFGNAGLTWQYGPADNSKLKFWGQEQAGIRFLPVEP